MNVTALRQMRNNLLQVHPSVSDLQPFFDPSQVNHLAIVLDHELHLDIEDGVANYSLRRSPMTSSIDAYRIMRARGFALSLEGFAALQDPEFVAKLRRAITYDGSWWEPAVLNLRCLRRQIPRLARRALGIDKTTADALFNPMKWDIDLRVWYANAKDLKQKAEVAAEAVDRVIGGMPDEVAWRPSWAQASR